MTSGLAPLVANIDEDLAQLRHLVRSGLVTQPTQSGAGVGANGGERLVDLV
jgi:hypothetical protein